MTRFTVASNRYLIYFSKFIHVASINTIPPAGLPFDWSIDILTAILYLSFLIRVQSFKYLAWLDKQLPMVAYGVNDKISS